MSAMPFPRIAFVSDFLHDIKDPSVVKIDIVLCCPLAL